MKKLICPSGRYIFRVIYRDEENKIIENCYNNIFLAGNLCDCSETKAQSPQKGIYLCDHLYAAKVSAALTSYEEVKISEFEFSNIFKKMIFN